MQSDYIEQRGNGYYVRDTRISLDSVVHAFNGGDSPERILEEFPLIGNLARVYGALAFYLDHRPEIDSYLETAEREFEGSALPLQQASPALWKKVEEARAARLHSGQDSGRRS